MNIDYLLTAVICIMYPVFYLFYTLYHNTTKKSNKILHKPLINRPKL